MTALEWPEMALCKERARILTNYAEQMGLVDVCQQMMAQGCLGTTLLKALVQIWAHFAKQSFLAAFIQFLILYKPVKPEGQKSYL